MACFGGTAVACYLGEIELTIHLDKTKTLRDPKAKAQK
jgi:hypothetical protein